MGGGRRVERAEAADDEVFSSAGLRRVRDVARRAGTERADDLTQDTFVRYLETARRQPVAAPLRLVGRIARNLVIDQFRAARRRGRLYADDVPDEIASEAPDAERMLLARDRLTRTLAIIAAMPPRRREVFLLHRIEELTYARIAARLGISVKAVEKHIAAAMAQLSATLRDGGC